MATIKFNPQTLDTWVNDETRLNAQNMNKLKDAIVYINDTIRDKNGTGIAKELNDLHDSVRGTKDEDGIDVTWGVHQYLQTLFPQIYGTHILFDKTNPQDFITAKYSSYVKGEHKPVYPVSLNSDANKIDVELKSQFDAEGEITTPYYGIIQAAYNTQLYAEYTRTRLYAHENQYRPNSIHFANDLTQLTTNSSQTTLLSKKPLHIKSNDTLRTEANAVEVVGASTIALDAPEVIIVGLLVNGGNIYPVSTAYSLGTEDKPFEYVYSNTANFEDISSTSITSDSAIIDTAVVNELSVNNISGFNLRGSIIPVVSEESAVSIGDASTPKSNLYSSNIYTNSATTTTLSVENIVLSTKLTGGTLNSTVLNNVQVSSDILPHDDKDVSIGSSTKPFFDVYATKLISTDGELTGEQKTSDNSIVKYVTLKAEIDARISADTQHTKEIESLNKATENLSTETQTLNSSIDSIQKDIEDIKANPVNVEFEDSQFDVDVNVVSLKSFSDAVDGSYPVKSGGIITWVKPDNTTVEGIAQSIATLESNVSTLQSSVNSYEVRVSTLETQFTTLRTEFDTLVIDEGSID